MKASLLVFFSLALSLAYAEKMPFDRYQSIVDRQMFGPLPPGFDPTKPPNEVQRSAQDEEAKELTQEQAKLQSSIHFSVINVTPDGSTAVGFTDNSDPKAPVHYYLRVGETSNGWAVKEADPEEATMTISKDDIEVSLKLGDNSGKGGGSTTARAGGAAPAATPGPGMFTLGSRRRLRQQAEAAERAKADEAARAKEAERQAQAQAQAEQERQQHEAERAEMSRKLQEISEALKQNREEKAKAAAAAAAQANSENNNESSAEN